MGSCGRGAYGAEKMVVSEGLRGCCSTTTEGEADCVGSCREKMSWIVLLVFVFMNMSHGQRKKRVVRL